MSEQVNDRRLYNKTERRMIKNGRPDDAKQHWFDRYINASLAKRPKMFIKGS